VHLKTFLSIPITQKLQILSCDTLVANERYLLWGKATPPFFFVISNRYTALKNTLGCSAVVFCACEIMVIFCTVLCAKAVHKFGLGLL